MVKKSSVILHMYAKIHHCLPTLVQSNPFPMNKIQYHIGKEEEYE